MARITPPWKPPPGVSCPCKPNVEAKDHRNEQGRRDDRLHCFAQRWAIFHLANGRGGHILLPPQQHGDPDRCGKQDELLAQGIEPAVIVVDGVDCVGGMALIDRKSRDHISVGPAILPPGRQVQGCVAVEPQKNRPCDKKNAKAKTVSHALRPFAC